MSGKIQSKCRRYQKNFRVIAMVNLNPMIMKQPALGQKILELSNLKYYAWYCSTGDMEK